jgi:hypothetical protein
MNLEVRNPRGEWEPLDPSDARAQCAMRDRECLERGEYVHVRQLQPLPAPPGFDQQVTYRDFAVRAAL